MTTATAVEEALACVFIAVNEVLPPTHQRVIGNILARAVDERIVGGEARDLIERLLGRPRWRRASPRTARARTVRR